jgi:NADH dehydrogenase [ubiquinone] 1 alpha subcomplex assembly factor 7
VQRPDATPAAEAIRARILEGGPIGFDTYMELALYGPGGFYERPPVGADGDFVTSPHVHPAFGTFVARALSQLRDTLAPDRDLSLTEVGAGDGTLASQVLGALERVRYTAVEISSGALAALAARDGIEVADELRPPMDVVLAHELLDNLPFRLVRDGEEVTVGVDGDALVERTRAIDPELRTVIGDRPIDGDLVVPTGAFAFIDRMAASLEHGYALLIDYGGGASGPVHGYRRQQPVDDVVRAPGAVDVTAGVDFTWIADHARSRSLHAFPLVDQRDVLLALGFESWLRDELATQQDQLARGAGLDAVRTWSMRSRATMLVDPAALGRMRWLLLATEGLAAPPWLDTATHDRTTD